MGYIWQYTSSRNLYLLPSPWKQTVGLYQIYFIKITFIINKTLMRFREKVIVKNNLVDELSIPTAKTSEASPVCLET